MGAEMQIKAAFRHDVWLPKNDITAMPRAADIGAVAVSMPRILGSL